MALNVSILIVLAAAAAIAVSHLGYRRTTPPLGTRVRTLLTGLRALSYLLVIFLMTDPRFIRHSERVEPATVIGLIDRSESMSLPARGWDAGSGPARFDAALEIARQAREDVESKGGLFVPVYFSGDGVVAPADSVIADGQGTDVRGAIEEAVAGQEGRNIAGVVLISDGIDTEERLVRPPAPPVPVYAIGLGDTAAPEDVRIRDVEYSSVVGAPSRSSIRAALEYSGGSSEGGAKPKHVHIRLREGDRTIFEADTVFAASREIVTEIPIEFAEAGRRRFSVDVIVSGSDAEEENNRREIVIDAQKSERKILIVDLSPTWELSFLTGLLRREPSFDFDVVAPVAGHPSVGKEHLVPRGEFARRLGTYDAVVIASVDQEGFADEAAAIERFVREDGKGLLVLPGPGSLFERPDAWSRLSSVLPADGVPPIRFNLKYTTLRPGPNAAAHPITSPLVPVIAQSDWQQRSPLLGCFAPLAAKPGSEVLLETEGSRSPALLCQTVGEGRTALLAAGPLWRWKFLADDAPVYDQLVSRMLDFLSRGGEAERFVLRASKNVYDSGEPGALTGEVFDERMQPVTGVPVRVELSRVDGSVDVPLDVLSMQREGSDNTRFKAPLPPMGPGRYRVRGEADLPGGTIESAPLEITVSDVSVEFQRVHQDRANLKLIAAQSGGFYMGEEETGEFAEKVELRAARTATVSEVALRTSLIVFSAIVLLLSVEWIIRKRVGMI